MGYRVEHDTLGEKLVPADRYWGAQTQRSLENFPIESKVSHPLHNDQYYQRYFLMGKNCMFQHHQEPLLKNRL